MISSAKLEVGWLDYTHTHTLQSALWLSPALCAVRPLGLCVCVQALTNPMTLPSSACRHRHYLTLHAKKECAFCSKLPSFHIYIYIYMYVHIYTCVTSFFVVLFQKLTRLFTQSTNIPCRISDLHRVSPANVPQTESATCIFACKRGLLFRLSLQPFVSPWQLSI